MEPTDYWQYSTSMKEYREVFDVFDLSKDGKIRMPELRNMMTQLGQEITEKELQDIMASADKKNVGFIDFDGFCSVMMSCAPRSLDVQLRKAFQLINKDGNGCISSSDLKGILRNLGDVDVTDEEIDDLIREMDLDGNGEVDFEEFVKMMLTTK